MHSHERESCYHEDNIPIFPALTYILLHFGMFGTSTLASELYEHQYSYGKVTASAVWNRLDTHLTHGGTERTITAPLWIGSAGYYASHQHKAKRVPIPIRTTIVEHNIARQGHTLNIATAYP